MDVFTKDKITGKKNEIEVKKKTFVVYIHHTVFKINVFTMQKRKRAEIDVNKTGSILFTRFLMKSETNSNWCARHCLRIFYSRLNPLKA